MKPIKNRLLHGLLQYFQYSAIGISCGVIDIGSLNLFLFLWPTDQSLLLTVYNSVAYGLAVLNSYIWNSRLTFRAGTEKGYRQKILFIIQAGVSLLISNVVLLLAVDGLEWLPFLPLWLVHNTAKGISMFCSATASFFFMKFVVFRRRQHKQSVS